MYILIYMCVYIILFHLYVDRHFGQFLKSYILNNAAGISMIQQFRFLWVMPRSGPAQ